MYHTIGATYHIIAMADFHDKFFVFSLFFQIVVQVRDEGNGWIVGRTGSVEGAFPASYVEKLHNNGPD